MSKNLKNLDESQGLGNTNQPNTRSRRWCFTLNNYTLEEKSHISALFQNSVYFIQGEEVGAEGTPHLQGYVEFKHQKTLSALKKINKRIHWEIARGNRDQNIKYCSKENKIEVAGDALCTKRFIASEEFKKKCINDSFERYKNKNKLIIDFDIDTANACANFMY